MTQPALFLDRDGTLVQPRHYPTRPEELRLYAGIAPELRALQARGMRVVVITNQAGIARGYLTEADLVRMHAALCAELETLSVCVDGIYHCPHHPEGVVPALAVRCGCRKPAPGLLLRAAAELDLDLARSWFVGDILDDVEAGNRAGCRTVLVDLGTEPEPPSVARTPSYMACDTCHALRIVRAAAFGEGAAELDYRPARWGPPAGAGAEAMRASVGGDDAYAR
ncbi:MAG TPA: HAD family hydrolase [Chloroflexota bacterium]|jgi:D-glycero-D-manno-heptose 1,7-bisphosphate phosphatase